MGMIGLIGGEMARVDLPPAAVGTGTGRRAGPLKELDDARMRGGRPPRKLHRIALVVPPFLCDGVLVVRGDRRAVLVDAPLHAVGEYLGRVGNVADDLDGGPLVELRCAKP